MNVEALAKWRNGKEVDTARGARILRTASLPDGFWDVWNDPIQQRDLKCAGINLKKNQETGVWGLCWWQELPKEVTEERKHRIELSKATDAGIFIPKPDKLEYMPFQKGGIQYCLNVFQKPNDIGVLIADEMGLGKTIQAIGVINAIPSISRVLIICPLTLKQNWERELKKWLVRGMTIGHANSEYFPKTDIVICHYNILHKWPTRLSNYWDLLISDEAHKIKNAKSRQTRCVVGYKPTLKKIKKGAVPTSGIPARRKLLLSGTPFENKPAELWPLISYIAPGLFSSRSAFEKRYCGASFNGHGYESNGATNLIELGERLRGSCMIRRLKSQVLTELPPKTRQVVEMETDGFEDVIRNEQRAFMDHECDLEAAQIEVEIAKTCETDDEFKNAISNLRQKTTTIFTELAKVRHETALAKTPKMIEMLKEELEEVNKIVVFAHHRDVLEMAAKEFHGECVMIHGETPQEERDGLVQRFQKDPKIRLFFGSIRATGEGITLTASSLVIFFENDWTASKMAQCSDRCHRIGQRDNVFVKYYILPGTIDAKMIQTWIAKEEIMEKALDSERPIIADEVTIIPKYEPLASRNEIAQTAVCLTEANRMTILSALKYLSSVCDGANRIDGAGFNKFDSAIGKSLANNNYLTPRQASLAQKLLRKYQGQLGEDVLEQCGIKLAAK